MATGCREGSDASTHVMICVDNSQHAELAFDHYVAHLHRSNNKVDILHVSDQVKIPPLIYAGGAFTAGAVFSSGHDAGMKAAVDDLIAANEALRKKYETKCNESDIKHTFHLVSEADGGPGATIVEEAKKRNVNLIVIGSRGLGAIRRTILGSISDYVVHHSHIPTVVCPVSQ